MTLLVTGGAGFVGSALLRGLLHGPGETVVDLDRLGYAGRLENLAGRQDSPRHVHERVDLRDRAGVEGVFRRHRPRAVVHLAAETHVDRSIDGPGPFVETNVLGTANLLEAARRHVGGLGEAERADFRFVHVSTDEVYGDLADAGGAATESDPYAPGSPYAASKAAADHLARAWHRTYGLPVIVTNCGNNYGPFQFPEKLVPHLILSALEGKDLPLYGDGFQVRDWIHVDDHARALRAALDRGRPGETYLLGARCRVPNREVAERICDLLDEMRPRPGGASHRERIAFVEDRPGHDRRYAIDPSKAERELGWRARVPFEAGLRETVRWYLENEAWWRPIREADYRGERLGLGS